MQVLFETTTCSESLIHARVIAFAYCSCYCLCVDLLYLDDDLLCLSISIIVRSTFNNAIICSVSIDKANNF